VAEVCHVCVADWVGSSRMVLEAERKSGRAVKALPYDFFL